MLKQIYKKLLSDKNAPQGDVSTDLKTALYIVACTHPLNIKDKTSHSLIRYFLEDVGFKSKTAVDFATCRELLSELEADGVLTLLGGSYYVRSASLVTKELEVKAKKQVTMNLKWYEEETVVLFYVQDEQGEDYQLIAENLVVLPGDLVEVSLSPEKKLAFVKQIVKERRCIIGTLEAARNPRLLTEDFALSSFKFVFSPNSTGGAKPGNVVIAEIVKRTPKAIQVKTRQVVKDLGKLNNLILLAALHHDIPSAWPEGMKRALARVPDHVSEQEIKGRRDLRELPLMTIDGEDARDFDDAVYVAKEGRNFRLYVAIADVSYYVRPGTVLDKEAVQRCNSVYFPNYVIPMLPEKLSNGICSLNPYVDRLCMVCEMVINSRGKTTSYEFYPAVMNSHARLTYTEAWQMIEKGTVSQEEHQPMIEHVKRLHELYKVLAKARDARGGFAVEREEVHFVFNEELKVVGLNPVVRNDAHKLIEECMIAANVAAASFIAEHKAQTLYRVHAQPTADKLSALNGGLACFGLSIGHPDKPTPVDYNNFCHSIEKRPDARILGDLLLRSMSKAVYQPDNIGHFGLALDKYAHFTSPIRRYADLQLHRSIKAVLEKGSHPDWGRIGARTYNKPELAVLGARCTDREIAADYAENDVDTELKCILLKRFEGEVTRGTISAVTHFGAFVHLEDFLIDGLLYIGNIADSYMEVNEQRQCIEGGGITLKIGDKLDVLIGSVQVKEHKIDLLLPRSKKAKQKTPVSRDAIFVKPEDVTTVDVASAAKPLFDSIADLTSGSDKALKKAEEEAKAEAAKQELQAAAAEQKNPQAEASRDKVAPSKVDELLPKRPEQQKQSSAPLTLGDLIRSGVTPRPALNPDFALDEEEDAEVKPAHKHKKKGKGKKKKDKKKVKGNKKDNG